MKRVEVTYIPPRRFCRRCRKNRASFPDSNGESFCSDCTRKNLESVLETLNVRPSDARRE